MASKKEAPFAKKTPPPTEIRFTIDTVLWHHTYDNGGHLLFAAIIRDWRFAIYVSHTSAE